MEHAFVLSGIGSATGSNRVLMNRVVDLLSSLLSSGGGIAHGPLPRLPPPSFRAKKTLQGKSRFRHKEGAGMLLLHVWYQSPKVPRPYALLCERRSLTPPKIPWER